APGLRHALRALLSFTCRSQRGQVPLRRCTRGVRLVDAKRGAPRGLNRGRLIPQEVAEFSRGVDYRRCRSIRAAFDEGARLGRKTLGRIDERRKGAGPLASLRALSRGRRALGPWGESRRERLPLAPKIRFHDMLLRMQRNRYQMVRCSSNNSP